MPNRMTQAAVLGLSRFFGETVTVYTTSGGESGQGFTGVLISINPGFIRLLSDIGPAPACALGSCCKQKHHRNCGEEETQTDRLHCNLRNVGAVVDIPINRIAAFVHNAI